MVRFVSLSAPTGTLWLDTWISSHCAHYRAGMKRKSKRAEAAPDPAKLAPKATGSDLTLHSGAVGALPIINTIIDRMGLADTLDEFLPQEDRRNKIKTADAIVLLAKNILLSRQPLYGIGGWAAGFVPQLLGLQQEQLKSLNDDRVGRALDRLFDLNVPEFVMTVTKNVVRRFDLELSELHNDSTTVRFYGDYDEFEQPVLRRGKTTVAIRQGHSKDHRPDLKQLLYILTVTDDGGVPIYFTTDDGDKHDDQTHVPTWDLLRELTGRADFLYIADCKLASSENLRHIDSQGGRFITILPKNRSEPKRMKRVMVEQPDSLRWVDLYETRDEEGNVENRFKTLREEQVTADGYRLIWIHSLAKAATDDGGRIKTITKAIDDLTKLRARLQSPRTRMRQRHRVEAEVEKILTSRRAAEFIHVELIEQQEPKMKQKTPGRRTESTQYLCETKLRFDLSWRIDTDALARARLGDGVFPLICNDSSLSAESILMAYKRQPIIEKRFSQLKTDFNVAPVFLKEVSRIESILCVYFLSLMIQTLLEREIRQAMETSGIEALPLYPEGRPCRRPTTRRVIDAMESLSQHRLVTEDGDVMHLHTDPTPLQKQLMKLFGIKPSTYGRG